VGTTIVIQLAQIQLLLFLAELVSDEFKFSLGFIHRIMAFIEFIGVLLERSLVEIGGFILLKTTEPVHPIIVLVNTAFD